MGKLLVVHLIVMVLITVFGLMILLIVGIMQIFKIIILVTGRFFMILMEMGIMGWLIQVLQELF